MYYDTAENNHGLKHNPWKSLLVPRPIGWISTVDKQGQVNLAPYSFFNGVGDNPNYVMFASGGRKHSMRNAEDTGEFVCIMATWDLREQMNITSADFESDVDEMAFAGLTPVASKMVKPPRIAQSPVAIECKYHQTVNLPGRDDGKGVTYSVIIGRVVGIYIDDAVISDGVLDMDAIKPIARLGNMDYSVVRQDNMFTLARPDVDELLSGKS